MAAVTYIARRGLVSYHVAESTYSVDFSTSDVQPPSGDDMVVRSESLSGTVETLYFGERRTWRITTAPLRASSGLAQLLVEFLRSTADGQQFTFDPYGFSGQPVQPLLVIRQDNGFARARFVEIDGQDDFIGLSFEVREV